MSALVVECSIKTFRDRAPEINRNFGAAMDEGGEAGTDLSSSCHSNEGSISSSTSSLAELAPKLQEQFATLSSVLSETNGRVKMAMY
jgi:hypothetical protein